MAKKKTSNKNKKNNNVSNKNNSKNTQLKKESPKNNVVIMKVLVFLGVIILCGLIIYLMNYFFVEKSYIKINMSTDKKVENMTIAGKEELITTQKYVSDLGYSMRYDVKRFSVFKYKEQDIFKFIDAEKILVIVEKSSTPGSCSNAALDTEYNSCMTSIDDYTNEYYISGNGKSYKLTVKTPNNANSDKIVKTSIDYMLNSFEMNK